MYNTGFDCVGWSPRRWSDGFRLLTSQQPSFSRWSAARRQRCGCDAAAPTGRRSDPAPPPSRWRHHRCCLHTWAFTTNKPRMGSAHTMYICVDSIFIGSPLAQVESRAHMSCKKVMRHACNTREAVLSTLNQQPFCLLKLVRNKSHPNLVTHDLEVYHNTALTKTQTAR